jgi:AcrR family transcriptional regulator
MAIRPSSSLTSRKQPKQARSTDLVAAILEAAVQVLAKEGAQRFTAARVAEKAGVSVGSLYQYFPNKAAILFRLQSDEWRQTSELLRGILEDGTRPPLERLRKLVHAFIRSECEEGRDPRRPRRRCAALSQCARGAAREGVGKRDHPGLHAGGASRHRRRHVRIGGRLDQDDAERGRKTVLGGSANA